MMDFLTSVLKVFGVVFLRFRPVPRIWAVWLVAVNLGCLYFITHVEAQAVLVPTLVAVLIQARIHQKIGFTRLLGVAHVLWIPMFGWMATRLPEVGADGALQAWLVVLFATNVVSFIIDGVDVLRFARGERRAHYSWS